MSTRRWRAGTPTATRALTPAKPGFSVNCTTLPLFKSFSQCGGTDEGECDCGRWGGYDVTLDGLKCAAGGVQVTFALVVGALVLALAAQG